MLAPIVEAGRRNPWNKGKLVGQKAPLKLRDIWGIRVRLELGDRKRELALFNLAIDSSCAAAISCNCAFAMSLTAIGSPRARSSCNKKLNGRFSSKSRSSPENRSSPGSDTRHSKPRIIYFRAGYGYRRIYRRDNTPELSQLGSRKSAWTPTRMEPIRCAARKPPSSIAGPRTCAQYSCY